MHRFHLPPEKCRGTEVLLPPNETHHAVHVLRLRTGEQVGVLDGAGTELVCEVIETGRNQTRLGVKQRRALPPPPCQITLLQAVPKGKIIESIIQKATELGVSRVVPLLSERTTLRLDPEAATGKLAKWREIAVEAIKQCGSAWLTAIDPPMTPAQFLARKERFDLPLLGSLQPGARHPREYFQRFTAEHGTKPRSVCIWIGPEGDFAPAEVAAVESWGALPITLGSLVLRSETAAVYSLSIIQYELQAPGGNGP